MIAEMVEKQRAYFNSGATWPLEERRKNLLRLKELLLQHQADFIAAFKADFNKCEFDVLATEFYLVIDEADYQIKHLKKQCKPKKVRTSIFNFPSKGYLLQEPYGVCLIIAPWNYPLQLALEPLMGCIAAGNTALLKPASATANVAKVLKAIATDFGKPELFDVILGSHQENADLLDQKYDYIFFTGGASTGKEILAKAAVHLTPCSLELGGKSPCIIDEDADVDLAAKRAVWGKYLNGGQTCVAPDYFYVHEAVHDAFIAAVKKYIQLYFYKDGKLSEDFPAIINDKQLAKVTSFIDPRKVVAGGHVNGRFVEPTVLDHVSWDDKVMSDEIFGPIMPVLTFTNLEDLLKLINVKEKPLAFYYFSKNGKKAKHVMAISPFGGGCVNDTIMHLTNDNLPFGGVGRSGMGSYHGAASFKTFSHQKSVLVKGKAEINLKYPPYSEKKLHLFKKFTHLK